MAESGGKRTLLRRKIRQIIWMRGKEGGEFLTVPEEQCQLPAKITIIFDRN